MAKSKVAKRKKPVRPAKKVPKKIAKKKAAKKVTKKTKATQAKSSKMKTANTKKSKQTKTIRRTSSGKSTRLSAPGKPLKTQGLLRTAAAAYAFMSPLDDRILVSVIQAEGRTSGGLFLPDTVATPSREGHVLAVGPGKRSKKGLRRPPDVQVGDRVMLPEYGGSKLEFEGGTYMLIREEEILGVLE